MIGDLIRNPNTGAIYVENCSATVTDLDDNILPDLCGLCDIGDLRNYSASQLHDLFKKNGLRIQKIRRKVS